MELSEEYLQLGNQLCFPFYAVSRLITRYYGPLLEELNLTYPQYLVMLVLWEHDGVSIKQISELLLLNTNTLTPLLKRMEGQQLLERRKDCEDERRICISLTVKGKSLKEKALQIPVRLVEEIGYPAEDLIKLKSGVDQFFSYLKNLDPQ